MLTLTENASIIVRELATAADAPEAAGLRISATSEDATLEITHAPSAAPGDQVVESNGATLYLDDSASRELDDKILDAAVDSSGRVQFSLGIQP